MAHGGVVFWVGPNPAAVYLGLVECLGHVLLNPRKKRRVEEFGGCHGASVAVGFIKVLDGPSTD